jgi:hypothetical protein
MLSRSVLRHRASGVSLLVMGYAWAVGFLGQSRTDEARVKTPEVREREKLNHCQTFRTPAQVRVAAVALKEKNLLRTAWAAKGLGQ